MALRGHASIQGSTDIPTLFDLLPGYLPMPRPEDKNLDAYLARLPRTGFWGLGRAYTVSLLKAWFAGAAHADNDYCLDYLPRITGDHGTYSTVLDMIDGKISGYFLWGQNPAVGSAGARLQRLALAKLDWLVVRDLTMIESATFWRDSNEIARIARRNGMKSLREDGETKVAAGLTSSAEISRVCQLDVEI